MINITTAFLNDRKSTIRRQSNGRQKKRLTGNHRKRSGSQQQSSYPNGNDNILEQGLSIPNMHSGISTFYISKANTNRTTKVIIDYFVRLIKVWFFFWKIFKMINFLFVHKMIFCVHLFYMSGEQKLFSLIRKKNELDLASLRIKFKIGFVFELFIQKFEFKYD